MLDFFAYDLTQKIVHGVRLHVKYTKTNKQKIEFLGLVLRLATDDDTDNIKTTTVQWITQAHAISLSTFVTYKVA